MKEHLKEVAFIALCGIGSFVAATAFAACMGWLDPLFSTAAR